MDFAASIELAAEREILVQANRFDVSENACGARNIQNYAMELLLKLDVHEFAAFYLLYRVFPVSRWLVDYKILFDNDGSDEFFGSYGGQTKEFQTLFEDSKLFWAGQADEVELLGIHGSLLADDEKMINFLNTAYGVETSLATEIISITQSLVKSSGKLGYDFPLWTLGALANSFHGEPLPNNIGIVPDKIILGDGLISYCEWADLQTADTFFDMIMAHEMAHMVQFQVFVGPDYPHTPETGLFRELMADAMGAYYSSHPLGSAMSEELVVSAYGIAFDWHPCDFSSQNSHGLPLQRVGAAQWGTMMAKHSLGKESIMTPMEIILLFSTEAFPLVVDPDFDPLAKPSSHHAN